LHVYGRCGLNVAVRGLALTEHFEPRARPRPDPWPLARAALLAGLAV